VCGDSAVQTVGKTFTRPLPHSCFPFKQLCGERDRRGKCVTCCDGGQLSQAPSAAEESTLRRWWKEYSAKMQEWAGLLESGHTSHLAEFPALSSFSTHPLKRLETILSRFCLYLPRWAVMVKGTILAEYIHPLCLGSPSGYA